MTKQARKKPPLGHSPTWGGWRLQYLGGMHHSCNITVKFIEIFRFHKNFRENFVSRKSHFAFSHDFRIFAKMEKYMFVQPYQFPI
jgi:hypothetical protein